METLPYLSEEEQKRAKSCVNNILDKLNWLIARNRLYEAKKLVKQEIGNLKSITEKNL